MPEAQESMSNKKQKVPVQNLQTPQTVLVCSKGPKNLKLELKQPNSSLQASG